jgi:hypothetical protein
MHTFREAYDEATNNYWNNYNMLYTFEMQEADEKAVEEDLNEV